MASNADLHVATARNQQQAELSDLIVTSFSCYLRFHFGGPNDSSHNVGRDNLNRHNPEGGHQHVSHAMTKDVLLPLSGLQFQRVMRAGGI